MGIHKSIQHMGIQHIRKLHRGEQHQHQPLAQHQQISFHSRHMDIRHIRRFCIQDHIHIQDRHIRKLHREELDQHQPLA